MKHLTKNKSNINYLIREDKHDLIPYFENSKIYFSGNNYVSKWEYRSSNKSKNPYYISDRIITNNIGKSFDLSFSYFCKLCSKHEQKIFLDKFTPQFSNLYSEFIIDNNGNIQYGRRRYYKRYKKPTYQSDGYQIELRHKITGKKKPEYFWLYKNKYKESDFIPVVVSGYELIFDSFKDPTYIRLTKEREKRDKINRKKLWKSKILSEEKFREILNREKLKDREEAKLKMERKGFDPIKSFRNINR